MRFQQRILTCLVLMMMAAPLATAQEGTDSRKRSILSSKSIEDDGYTQPLIEWFCDSDSRVCTEFEQDNALLMDRDEGMVWISWHQSLDNNDPLGNGDSNIRADELTANPPAIRLDFQRLTGVDDGADFNPGDATLALNDNVVDAGGVVAAELPLEVILLDLDDDDIVDEIEVSSEFKPLVNLSSDVILHMLIVEWYPEVRNEGPRPAHVVREWTATAAFSKRADNVTLISHTFGEEHLKAAGIEIDADNAQRWGLIAFLSGHVVAEGGAAGDYPPPEEPAVVLALAEMDLPTKWEGTSVDEALPRLGLLLFSLICVAIIILTERQREHALPRITGRLLQGDEEGGGGSRFTVVVDIQIGKHDASIDNVEVMAPWKLKKKFAISRLKAGEQHSDRLSVRCEEEYQQMPVVIRFSLEVDTFGGWMMDLRLTPPRNDDLMNEKEPFSD